MEDRQRLLIEKYLAGTCSEEERRMVDEWMDNWAQRNGPDVIKENDSARIAQLLLNRINGEIAGRERAMRRKIQLRRYAVAASIVFALLLSTVLWLDKKGEVQGDPISYTTVEPGSKSAVLLYSGGKEIDLSSLAEEMSLNNGMKIRSDGSLASLENLENANQRVSELNEVRIPKGGQYQLKLMDGTKVYLNSASRLIFPTRFDSDVRKVKLEGEAYFEVVHNDTPFIVELDGHAVQVLGTEFNVKAYDKKQSYTTLVKGKVMMKLDNGGSQELKPGQQAMTDDKIVLREVDVKHFTSWKEGYFSFDFMNIKEIMNEISRWYDIEYEIRPGVDIKEEIGGTFSRDKSLGELLNYVEKLMDIKITKNGNKVTLTK